MAYMSWQEISGWLAQQSLRTQVFIFIALLLLLGLVHRQLQRKSQLGSAPGPRGLPLVGRLFEFVEALKTSNVHLFYQKYARQYGEICQIPLGACTQFIVSSDLASKALFDKQASASSNRPPTLVSRSYTSGDCNLLHLDGLDPTWKLQRKVIANHIGSVPKADEGLPYLHCETLKFLFKVANDPTIQSSGPKLWQSVWRYQFSNFALQFFGLDVPHYTDDTIHYIHETQVAQIIGTFPGAYIVDMLQFLRHLPMSLKPWERSGRERFQRDMGWCVQRLERVKAMPDRSAIKDSVLCKIIEDDQHLGHPSKEVGSYFCFGALQAAADTSATSTWSFIEAMMTFPDVQEKARKLVDETVGDRIPVWEDYERIPYIRCLVKEVWRWRPPVVSSPEHVLSKDLTYDKYHFKAGSRFVINIWGINHDPARHSDPENFVPERYEGDNTSAMQSLNSADPRKRDHYAFGAGRRVCPGYNVAERSVAVAIMRILWAFEVSVKEGTEMTLDRSQWKGDFSGSAGKDMPAVLRPRSKERVEIINREFRRAEMERGPVQPMDLPKA